METYILSWVDLTTRFYPIMRMTRKKTSLKVSSVQIRLRFSIRYDISFATYLGSKYDASTTNLTYLISSADSKDPLEIILSFLSPITPTSTLRQAIPASYLTVHVKGNFNIDIYLDLNGQWVSGDTQSSIVWDFSRQKSEKSNQGLKTWKVKRKTELMLSEFREQAEWGTLYFTAPLVGSNQAIMFLF